MSVATEVHFDYDNTDETVLAPELDDLITFLERMVADGRATEYIPMADVARCLGAQVSQALNPTIAPGRITYGWDAVLIYPASLDPSEYSTYAGTDARELALAGPAVSLVLQNAYETLRHDATPATLLPFLRDSREQLAAVLTDED